MAEDASLDRVLARLWTLYGPKLVWALLVVLGMAAGRLWGLWETHYATEAARVHAQVATLTTDLGTVKLRLYACELNTATLKDQLTETRLAQKDMTQWVQGLERYVYQK
jgi:hypothetical protein